MASGRGSTPRRYGPGGRRHRPSGATRPRSAAEAAPRPRLTARAAVLVLVVAALVMSYGSSLRAYLEQRAHLASVRASIADAEGDIAAMEREKARWRDDAYVIAQARERLAFGFPGEVGYRVLDEDGQPLDHEDSLSEAKDLGETDPEWWEVTLESVETAGNPPKQTEPADKIAPEQPDEQGKQQR